MVLGGRAFAEWSGYKGRTHLNGISAQTDDASETSHFPFARWGRSKQTAIYEQEAGPHQILQLLVTWLWISSLQNGEKEMSIVNKPPRLWDCVTEAWANKDKGPLHGRTLDPF